MSDEESGPSEDETEILVYVEFEGYVDSGTFKNDKLELDIVGIDSDHPIMQVNGKFYEGTYHDAVGTYMFFDHDNSPVVDDPVFDTPATLKYFAKTRKLLKMERVFAMQRTEVLGDLDHNYCIPNMDTIQEAGVPPKYQEDALKFWMNMRDDRMQALTSYLEKQQIREEKRSRGIELDSDSDDDNPFAMYKPRQDKATEDKGVQDSKDAGSSKSRDIIESEDSDISGILNRIKNLDPNSEASGQCSKKPVKKLTVIDPGPSTSRHSDLDMPSLTTKKRRKGVARVTSKLKSKDVFKKPNKRAPKSKKSVQNSMMSHDFEEGVGIGSPEVETELSFLREIEDVNLSDFFGTTSSSDYENSQSVEERSSEKTVCHVTKRLEKQARRDAKMKEISERLKTLKETQLKIHNSSSLAKDSESRDT